MDKIFFLMALSSLGNGIMRRALFLAALAALAALSSCMTHQDEIFRVSSGEILICQRYAQQDCGLHLMQCGEHSDLELECLSDVHYLGRPGHLTKESTETPVIAVNVWETPVAPQVDVSKPTEFSCTPCMPVPAKAKKKKRHK